MQSSEFREQSQVQSAELRVQSEESKPRCTLNSELCAHSALCTLHSELTCPVCEQRFYESDNGVAMPFCSRRCKMIDAARWLDERYGMPVEKAMEDDFPDVE